MEGFQSSETEGTLQLEWNKIHDNLRNNALLRRLQLQIAETEAGREAMELQRRQWARHEMPAPFDFLFGSQNDQA